MPSGDTPRAPRPDAPARSRARGRPASHHVIAVLLGLAALVGLAVSGIVPGLLPSPTAEAAPGPATAPRERAATATGARSRTRDTVRELVRCPGTPDPRRARRLGALGGDVRLHRLRRADGQPARAADPPRLGGAQRRQRRLDHRRRRGRPRLRARPAPTSPAPTSCSSRWAPTTSTSTASRTAAASRPRGRPAGPRRSPDCATG